MSKCIASCKQCMEEMACSMFWRLLKTGLFAQGKGPGLMRLLSYNRPEWHWIVLGLAGSAFMGLVMPIFAYSLSSVIAVFFVTDYAYMDQEARTPGQHHTGCPGWLCLFP